MPVWRAPSLLANSLDRSRVQQHIRHSQLPLSKAHQADDHTKAPAYEDGFVCFMMFAEKVDMVIH